MSDFDIENGILICYSGNSEEVIIPGDVTGIGEDAFKGNSYIKKVKIPATVEFIEPYAFSECANLSDVEFDAFPEICFGAFEDCPLLVNDSGLIIAGDVCVGAVEGTVSIKIPDGIRYISLEAFAYNESIENLYIPKSVEVISEKAFIDCYKLSNVTIEDGAYPEIMEDAFNGCRYLLNGIFAVTGRSLRSVYGKGVFTTIPGIIETILPEAFNECMDLVEIYLPKSIKTLGDRSFSKCKNLKKVVFEESEINIGRASFIDCFSLEEVKLPQCLKVIPANCFRSCINLRNIEFPESLTEISNYAFCDCLELREAVIPENLISIGDYAFSNCKKFSKINFPSGLMKIGKYAFSYTSLTEIVIPDKAFPEDGAFYNCYSLQTAEFLGRIETFKTSLFRECDNLIRVDVPDSIRNVGNYAFSNCSKLEGIDISNAVYIGDYAFADCSSLKNLLVPEGHPYIGKSAFSECNSLCDGRGMAVVKNVLYSADKNIKVADIPDGVTIISFAAFSGCYDLEEVIFPDSVEYISDRAFLGCGKLSGSIKMNSVKTIGQRAFADCDLLEEIHAPNVQIVMDNAFLACHNLKVFDINSSARLGEYALYGCNRICDGFAFWGGVLYSVDRDVEKIVLGGDIKVIGASAFKQCENIREVVLPEGVTKIEPYAFSKCYSLEKINIPESLTVIEDSAFEKCEALSGILEMKSVTRIGDFAFQNCTHLGGVVLPSVQTVKFSAFDGCQDLVVFDVPEETVVEEHALRGCNRLCGNYSAYKDTLHSVDPNVEEFVIPEEIRHIESRAFYKCNRIRQIVFPEQIVSIGSQAVLECESLEKVIFLGNNAKVEYHPIYACPSLKEIHSNQEFTNDLFIRMTGYVEIFVDSLKMVCPEDSLYAVYGCLRQLSRDSSKVSVKYIDECRTEFQRKFQVEFIDEDFVLASEMTKLIDDVDMLAVLLKYKFLTSEVAGVFLEYSVEIQDPEKIAMLMQYMQEL